MLIPQDTVQQILQASDVVDVIGDFVSLKKRGANLIACCPFHNEKTPSFYVSPAKQIYKCFGCGKAGDSVRFIMDIEGISYPEALKWLAKKYGIEVKEKEYTNEELQAQSEKESLYIVLEFASKFYQQQLWESETGQAIGLSYYKERGFNHTTIKSFDLGYSPDGWDIFTKHALKQGFSLEILEKAGLTIIKEGKEPIDRFRGRVIFPIHNLAGKPIAFGARILRKDPNAPKYLNSPETAVYHKSHIVYGIAQAKNAIRNEDNCYLVEGYTDVVSLHQAGIENVVASSGTSLTKEQIQLIRRFTPNITVLYDGDAAGIKASLRGIDLILEEGMNVKSVVFPDGDDPDSFVQKMGSQGFKEYIKNTQKDFIRFKTEISLKDVGDDPIKRANLITELVETITKIPESIKRAVFYKEVAELLKIEEYILIAEGNKISRKQAVQTEKDNNRRGVQFDKEVIPVQPIKHTQQTEAESKRLPTFVHEEECCRLLICYGRYVLDKNVIENIEFTLADYIFQEIRDMNFHEPVFDSILNVFRTHYFKGEILKPSFFTHNEEQNIQSIACSWLTPKHELSEGWLKSGIIVPLETDILDTSSYTNILRLKKSRYDHESNQLMKALETAENFEEQEQILLKLIQYKDAIKKLADVLGTVVQG